MQQETGPKKSGVREDNEGSCKSLKWSTSGWSLAEERPELRLQRITLLAVKTTGRCGEARNNTLVRRLLLKSRWKMMAD